MCNVFNAFNRSSEAGKRLVCVHVTVFSIAPPTMVLCRPNCSRGGAFWFGRAARGFHKNWFLFYYAFQLRNVETHFHIWCFQAPRC